MGDVTRHPTSLLVQFAEAGAPERDHALAGALEELGGARLVAWHRAPVAVHDRKVVTQGEVAALAPPLVDHDGAGLVARDAVPLLVPHGEVGAGVVVAAVAPPLQECKGAGRIARDAFATEVHARQVGARGQVTQVAGPLVESRRARQVPWLPAPVPERRCELRAPHGAPRVALALERPHPLRRRLRVAGGEGCDGHHARCDRTDWRRRRAVSGERTRASRGPPQPARCGANAGRQHARRQE